MSSARRCACAWTAPPMARWGSATAGAWTTAGGSPPPPAPISSWSPATGCCAPSTSTRCAAPGIWSVCSTRPLARGLIGAAEVDELRIRGTARLHVSPAHAREGVSSEIGKRHAARHEKDLSAPQVRVGANLEVEEHQVVGGAVLAIDIADSLNKRYQVKPPDQDSFRVIQRRRELGGRCRVTSQCFHHHDR